jgi:hypothetical protein
MKKIILTLLLGTFTAFANDEFIVVANPSVSASEVSLDDLKQVFLASKSSLGGNPVEPVLVETGAAHDAFLKKVVGKSDSAYRMHLKGLVFSGKATMPKAFKDEAAFVAYVAKTKGAIGYVSAGASTGGLKRITVK